MNVMYYIILAMKEMKQDYFNRYDENIEELIRARQIQKLSRLNKSFLKDNKPFRFLSINFTNSNK